MVASMICIGLTLVICLYLCYLQWSGCRVRGK